MVVFLRCSHGVFVVVFLRCSHGVFCGGVFCGGVLVVVFLWWCHPARELVLFGVLQDCGFVVVILLVVALSTYGPRTRTFRCFARLW